MKKRLTVIIALFLFTLFRLMYSGERLMLWIVLIIAAVFLLALINVAYTLIFTRINLTVSPGELSSGEFGTIVLSIRNPGLLPLAHLDIWYDTYDTLYGGGEGQCAAFSVMPGRTLGIRRQVYYPYRGIYRPGITKIEACDIFGLLKFKLPPSAYGERPSITVLPRPAVPVLPINGENPYVGVNLVGRNEQDPHSIAEIRQYRSGDPLKRIHWKLTARMGSMQVKEYDGTATPRTRLFVDLTSHSLRGEKGAAFENCVCSHAASACKTALEKTAQLRLTSFSDRGLSEISGSSVHDLARILRYLAAARFDCRFRFIDILRSELDSGSEYGNIVIITGKLTPELSAYASALAVRGLNVSLVSVRRDSDSEDMSEFKLPGVTAVSAVPEIISQPEAVPAGAS